MTQRQINVAHDVMARQKIRAEAFRRDRAREGTLVVQLLASPGAGKTSLLEATACRLGEATMAVLVGDLATQRDADRLRRVAPCVPLTTGGACHLEMGLVEGGFAKLAGDPVDFLFIEDVGNLVCPASHDVGHHDRVTLLSVTEGDDKAGKYPKAFRTSQALVISKIDLLPYVPFSIENAVDDARRIQSQLHVMTLSALKGDGMDEWISFLIGQRDAMMARGDYVDTSRQGNE
jgi:hydrogenase nickel incorporation protein HypB